MPSIKYNFIGLEALNDIEKDATCGKLAASAPSTASHMVYLDVIGIIKEVGEVTEIPTKTQRTVSALGTGADSRLTIFPGDKT